MNKEVRRKLPSEFTCYNQNITCKYSCETEFQSAIGSNDVRHLIVPYHYEIFSFLNSTVLISDELVMVEGRIFNAVSESLDLDECGLSEGVAQFDFVGENNSWAYSGASLERAIIVSIASLGDSVDDDYGKHIEIYSSFFSIFSTNH